jgi:hypothetical protein
LDGASVAGDPKYNVPPLNPLQITEIKVSQDNILTLTIQDVKMYGLLDIIVNKLE